MIRTGLFLGPRAHAIVLVGLLAAACAGPGGRSARIPEAERQAYALARAPLPEDMAASAQALEAFLVEYPNSQLADDAMEELARIEFLQFGRDAALSRLRETVARFPDGDRADSIRLRLALWDSEAANAQGAREWLEGIRPEGLNAAERRFFFRLGARLALTEVERLVYLAQFRAALAAELAAETKRDPLSPEAPALGESISDLDAEIDVLILGLPADDLLRVIPGLGSEVPAGRVRLVLCWRALVAGDLELAKFWLEEAARYPLTPTDSARMKSLAARLGTGDGEPDGGGLPTFREAAARSWPTLEGLDLRVGVVLPLSGRYAPFGQEALRGLLLAAQVFETRPPPAFVPRPAPDPLQEFVSERVPTEIGELPVEAPVPERL
nr:hypothetical protein [Myxococcota bacterium]